MEQIGVLLRHFGGSMFVADDEEAEWVWQDGLQAFEASFADSPRRENVLHSLNSVCDKGYPSESQSTLSG